MGIQEIIGNQKEQILAIAAKYGAYNIRIFGSVLAAQQMIKAMWILWSIWKRVAVCLTSAAC